jgi:hypothetical protein
VDITAATELVRRRAGEDVYARLFDSVATDEVLVVSGSLIEGIGNRRSDLDLFVISEERPRDVPVRMAFAGNSWVDIENVRPAAVDALVNKLESIDSKNPAQVLHLTHEQLGRYYRLAIGVAVKGSFHAQSAFSLGLFGAVLKAWAAVQAGAFAARAANAMRGGETSAAVRYASHAAHLCVEAALTDVGELYPSFKYAREKAIRAYGAASSEVAAITALLHPSGPQERYVAEVNEYVDATLAECFGPVDGRSVQVRPVEPLACDTRGSTPTLLARRSSYDLLPEDAAVVSALLSLPDLTDGAVGSDPPPGTWPAEAHRLVLRESLIDLGLLMIEGTGDDR